MQFMISDVVSLWVQQSCYAQSTLFAFCPYPKHSLLELPRSLLSLSGASGFEETVSTDIQIRRTMDF